MDGVKLRVGSDSSQMQRCLGCTLVPIASHECEVQSEMQLYMKLYS
jgi:hypothetical protein